MALGVTAKDLFEEQEKRFIKQKQKEEENTTNTEAKRAFNRPVYQGLFTRQDRCGNELGGRG